MAGFQALIAGLRRAEQQLEKQLSGIRSAISSLEFGGAVSPSFGDGRRKRMGRPKGSTGRRRRRKLSAAGRAAIVKAQKARWAAIRKAKGA
jgi:hypothetical protein